MYKAIKKIPFILPLIITLSLLFGCKQNTVDIVMDRDFPERQVNVANGTVDVKKNQVICHFDETAFVETTSQESGQISASVFFPSMKEMVQEFVSGNLRPTVYNHILRTAKQTKQSSIVLLDKEHLFEPIVPDSVEISPTVDWMSADFYNFGFREESGGFGYISFGTSPFNNLMKRKYTSFIDSHTVTKTNETKDESRNATVTEYITAKGYPGKVVHYQFESDGKQFLVAEDYCAITDSPESEQINAMFIFTQDGDAYMYIQFFDFTECPSLVWIASFGAKKFTDFGDLPETVTVPVTDAAPETVTETAKP